MINTPPGMQYLVLSMRHVIWCEKCISGFDRATMACPLVILAFIGSSSLFCHLKYFVRFSRLCVSLVLPCCDPACCSITLRVATLPSTFFDGTDSVSFQAVNVMGSASSTSAPTSSFNDDQDNDGKNITASFEATFFHCAAGGFWHRELLGANGSDEHTGTCEPCNENEIDGEAQVCVGEG